MVAKEEKDDATQTKVVRLAEDDYNLLDQLAKKEGRSKSKQAGVAIKKYAKRALKADTAAA